MGVEDFPPKGTMQTHAALSCFYWALCPLIISLIASSTAMGQSPLQERGELIPPSSDPLTSSSVPLLPGELIPSSQGHSQPESPSEVGPPVIHRTFTVYEEVIRKNKDLNKNYCVPKGYEVFQYSYVLHKRTRFTRFSLTQDPVSRECVLLVATLESSSKKLFGFFLKRPTARLHLKIHVVAKISSPPVPTLPKQPTLPQQIEAETPPSPQDPSRPLE